MSNKVHAISDAETAKENEGRSSFAIFKRDKITVIEVFLLGVTIVYGGQFTGWNDAYDSGYEVALFNVLLSGLGYICLTLCMAEMTSALPFSGGVYGFVRAFLHPWLGFVVACYELTLNLFYVSQAVYVLATLPFLLGVKSSEGFILGIAAAIYVVILLINIMGGKVFWLVNNGLSLYCLVLIAAYVLGGLSMADYQKWGNGPQDFSIDTILLNLPASSGIYLGIQYLPLLGKYVENPKLYIPRIMLGSMFLFFITAIALVTVTCSLRPGTAELGEAVDFVLAFGFEDVLHASFSGSIWLNFPGLFALSFGFLYCYGSQITCMASSGFLPEIFKTTSVFGTPYIGLVLGVILCFGLNVICYYNEPFLDSVTNISLLAGNIVFIMTCVAYIKFKYYYTSLTRSFYSPLRSVGAIIAILVYLLSSVGILGFWDDNIPVIWICVTAGLATLYYFGLIHKNQMFSEEEKDHLFKAYLINANKKKRSGAGKRQTNRQAKGRSADGSRHEDSSTVQQSATPSPRGVNFSFTHNSVVPDPETHANLCANQCVESGVKNEDDSKIVTTPPPSDKENLKSSKFSDRLMQTVTSSVKMLSVPVSMTTEDQECVFLQSGGELLETN